MYGLFDSGERWMGEHGVDVRALCFGDGKTNQRFLLHDDMSQVLEVKVYRAKGRLRITPEYQEAKALGLGTADVKPRNVDPRNSKKSQQQASKAGVKCVLLRGAS